MDEQTPLRIYKDMGGKGGSLAGHPHGQWTSPTRVENKALRFSRATSSMYALRIKTSLLSLHVQTQPSLPSPVSYHLCAKQVFPKTLWCQNTAPPWEALQPVGTAGTPNKGRCHLGCLSNKKLRKEACSRAIMQSYLLHTHKHTQTALTTMSRPVNSWRRSRRRRKTGPGECPNQGL